MNESNRLERIPLAPRQPCIETRVQLAHPVVTVEFPTSSDHQKMANNNKVDNNDNLDDEIDYEKENENDNIIVAGE